MNGPDQPFERGGGTPDGNGGSNSNSNGDNNSGNGHGTGPERGRGGAAPRPRIPPPRAAAEDGAWPPPVPKPGPGPSEARPPAESAPEPEPGPRPEPYDHRVLKSLLGAWALAACSTEETTAVEAHLTDCATCADEALRLRDAVGLLHPEDSLDLDPMLRARVLEGCLDRRPARTPIPEWTAPYDAETSRLDALLHDMAEAEWQAPVRLRWFDGVRLAERETTVTGVIGHLLAVDGLVSAALGLPDPLGATPLAGANRPAARTDAYWDGDPHIDSVRQPWRDLNHELIRTVSRAGHGVTGLTVDYGDFELPLRDAFVDRAFECWVHAGDIAEAVDYPYEAPAGPHLHLMVDLAARLLPGTLADRRRAGLAGPPRGLSPAGAPGRTLHLEVEGSGGGDWYIPLDSPAATASPERAVAHVALDGTEFCRLAAGHLPPQETAAGQEGDREAIRDVLFAAASLSRM